MIRVRQFLVTVAAVISGGLGAWAFIEAVRAEPAIVGTVATAIGGVVAVLYQQRLVEQARLQDAQRARMAPVYEELLDIMRRQMEQGSDGGKVAPELLAFMAELKGKQLLLGASSEMIQAFNRWSATADRGDSVGVLFAWEDLLYAIRKDLGHKDTALGRGDLLRLSITDIDDHLPAAA